MSSIPKKLINDVDRCVDDNLEGLVAVNPGLRLLKGHRVVIRSDIDEVISAGKVTILSGGGSGHEPGHAGYVGPGMLTASVAGPIFTSPPPRDILVALRAIGRNNPAGVLVTFNNYTGDRLTFGRAMEIAKTEGIKIALHINADDCALESVDKTAGRRGLAGGILQIKIAGAMAEDGKSLEEIIQVLQSVSSQLGTIGLCLTPCSLPGCGATFQLKSDEIGLGLGLHGEAGVRTIKMTTAREAVKIMIDHMTSTTNQTHLKVDAGDRVACALNNLGSTTFSEMNILAKEIIEYLEQTGVVVERFYSGHLITSQEMSGISITLLHLDDIRRQALAILGRLNTSGVPTDRPYELGLSLASLTEEAMGGSSGGLCSLFLTAASVPLKSSTDPHAWSSALQRGIDAVIELLLMRAWSATLQRGIDVAIRHGEAAPGYRTMLDALCPAQKAFSAALQASNGTDAFSAAVQAAEKGAESTAGMTARAGRASYVSSTSLANPDPGAMAVAIWMRAVLDALTSDES